MEGIESTDCKDSTCNCTDGKLINGGCPYNEPRRNKCLMHQLEHKKTKKTCRGSTARNLKKRTQEHFTDLRNAIRSKGEEKSDTFADAMRVEYKRVPKGNRLEKDFDIIESYSGK